MENDGIRDGNYTKEFFQKAWGAEGYFEEFSYGAGFHKVLDVALKPFRNEFKIALEIGSGGGTFTRHIAGHFKWAIVMDVIPRPASLGFCVPWFNYIELPDQCFKCVGVAPESIDFVFSYNVFCHLSDDALTEYFADIARVTRPGGDFVFMLSNYEKVSQLYFPEKAGYFKTGDLLPNGHFYQDQMTTHWIAHPEHWSIVNEDMIPEHRDRIVHLRRK